MDGFSQTEDETSSSSVCTQTKVNLTFKEEGDDLYGAIMQFLQKVNKRRVDNLNPPAVRQDLVTIGRVLLALRETQSELESLRNLYQGIISIYEQAAPCGSERSGDQMSPDSDDEFKQKGKPNPSKKNKRAD